MSDVEPSTSQPVKQPHNRFKPLVPVPVWQAACGGTLLDLTPQVSEESFLPRQVQRLGVFGPAMINYHMDVVNRYVFVEIQNRCIYIITSHHLRVQYIYIYISCIYIYIMCIYIYIMYIYTYIYIMYMYIYIYIMYIYIIIYQNLCVNYITYIYIHIHVQIDHPTRTCLRHTHTPLFKAWTSSAEGRSWRGSLLTSEASRGCPNVSFT